MCIDNTGEVRRTRKCLDLEKDHDVSHGAESHPPMRQKSLISPMPRAAGAPRMCKATVDSGNHLIVFRRL